jgi:hypothetical protein
METKVACLTCQKLILPDTAIKNQGLCVPCAKGYRKQIEAAQKIYEEEEKYRASEEYAYWLNLSQQVSDLADLKKLSFENQVYFVVKILIAEVFNGGFDQYFHNSSGDYYAETIQALKVLQGFESLKLLESAKALLFGTLDVPTEQRLRFDILKNVTETNNMKLDELDHSFWEFPDHLEQKLRQFVKMNDLFKVYE